LSWKRLKKNRRDLFNLVQEKLPSLPRLIVATVFGFVRSSGYYHSQREQKDSLLKEQVLAVLSDHPSYGYRRIALALGLGKKRIQRVMRFYHIHPYKRKARWRKRRDERRAAAPFFNQIKSECPCVPNRTWVSDFTYIPFKHKFIYLATIMDLFTREIVGWSLSNKHTKYLVMEAFLDGLVNQKMNKPICVHSDQGSEYASQDYTDLVQNFGVIVSMSTKASPWENGYQESFFNNFKTDLGLEFDRFEDVGHLTEAIHHTIHDYNYHRIHTMLKMPPNQFRLNFESRRKSV
jgi:putative transposase